MANHAVYNDGGLIGHVPRHVYDFVLSELRAGSEAIEVVRVLRDPESECPPHIAAAVVVQARSELRRNYEPQTEIENRFLGSPNIWGGNSNA